MIFFFFFFYDGRREEERAKERREKIDRETSMLQRKRTTFADRHATLWYVALKCGSPCAFVLTVFSRQPVGLRTQLGITLCRRRKCFVTVAIISLHTIVVGLSIGNAWGLSKRILIVKDDSDFKWYLRRILKWNAAWYGFWFEALNCAQRITSLFLYEFLFF